ncbi:HEPN domain-containing protein [Aquimarina rhabdastrellae]
MQSFRTEIENPIVEKDIIELAKKIELFKEGKMDEEKFRSLRLARGVYGQRQHGVQMIRIKLPYGKVSATQLNRIADVSDEYSTGRLHITTRQDIQIHYVSLDRTPELWAELEKNDVTLREACGNTVRNVTASAMAGVDSEEPFDVSPYAHAVFQFFLRNPVCQEMGRKFKISFSSSDKDTALSYIHDLGFIPKLQDGVRGFKIMLGGGLGSQPRKADVFYDFVATERIVPIIEGVLRVFDRYGERSKRLKARMKFLIKDIGLDAFRELVNQEQKALSYQNYPLDEEALQYEQKRILSDVVAPEVTIEDQTEFNNWKRSNVISQKQEGYVAIGVRVSLGDFYTDKARALANLINAYAGDELRFTLRQDILIPNIKEENIPFFYHELKALGFTQAGYNTTIDITACPGTDTCNLGIASSTGISTELERVIAAEYPEYIHNKEVTIKISGCMNACGQHNMAHIGFQGMSIRTPDKLVAPALQVLLGGGVLGNGDGRFADKVIKIPSKRGPEALRRILNDYETHNEESDFLAYYDKQGEKYFYNLLKDLANVENLTQEDFIDWGNKEEYIKAVGVGECAGVVIDLIATLFLESEEKLAKAKETFEEESYAHAIYHAYSAFVNSAKALLLAENKKTNTQASIIEQFDSEFVTSEKVNLEGKTFGELIYQLQKNEPSKDFAAQYIADSSQFLQKVQAYRKLEVLDV